MTKKILSILSIIGLLFGLLGAFVPVVRAADCVKTSTDPAPLTCGGDCPSGSGKTCQVVSNSCSCALPNTFQPAGPTDCIKVGSDFQVKLTPTAGARILTKVEGGAIILAGVANSKNCPYLTGDSPVNTVCTFTNVTDGIAKDEKCILPKASEIGIVGMLSIIYTVTNWIFYILTLVAVLMIIYGGFTYVAAAGDPAKATKGKTVLTLSIIGLAIALVAKFIPSLVKFVLGV